LFIIWIELIEKGNMQGEPFIPFIFFPSEDYAMMGGLFPEKPECSLSSPGSGRELSGTMTRIE
jgi:hypothetical protein